jgi:hypothetical protein
MINPNLNTETLKNAFLNAKPFNHVVIDDFLDVDYFNELSNALELYYNDNSSKGGVDYNSEVEDGKWGSQGLGLSSTLIELGELLKSRQLRNFLEGITGFTDLQITSDLNSSGYSFFHAMGPNSFLGPHTDHTIDMNGGSYHVLNIIIYASKRWDANWGGGTTLHFNGSKLATDIEYVPNRALVFMHSPLSIHGTQRISSLAEEKRFSIYFDFYSNLINPYSHLVVKHFELINSPHLFYFNSIFDYFKKENKKYFGLWRSHFKNLLISKFKF